MARSDVMVEPPRPTGGAVGLSLDGRLLATEGPNLVTLIVRGDGRVSLPVFATEEELRDVLAKAGCTFERIKQIDDGREFLASLPDDLNVITDIRFMPDGKIRYRLVVATPEDG